MAELELNQRDADALIALEKIRATDDSVDYPGLGGRVSVPLTSLNRREEFTLDVSRGRIDLVKGTYQTRARHVIILVRLDFGGPPHRNPDGEEVACPHLHVYREGYGDKWAVAVPKDKFSDFSNLWTILEEFMAFCNVVRPPNFVKGLFT